MKKIRFLSFVACLSLVLTSCGSAVAETTAEPSPIVTPDEENDGPSHSIPEEVRFDGEKLRLYTMEEYFGDNVEDYNAESVDAVYQANYDRLINVEERLGIDVQIINTNTWTDMPNMIRSSVNSGSDDYDIAFCCASYMNPLVNEGIFLQGSFP